jgi:hypothetical protein
MMAERRSKMGQVRWAGWAMVFAAAWTLSAGQAYADIASDKMAALLIYPKIQYDSTAGRDTVIRLTNTNTTQAILAHCFYLDANSHCEGGSADREICTNDPGRCTGGGVCRPGWIETDFRINLTAGQPIEWIASEGLADACPPASMDCDGYLPLPRGICTGNPFFTCGSDADCARFSAGRCTQSNVGTRIPRVPEDPFVGELKCIAVDANGIPVPRNELKGEAILTEVDGPDAVYDTASYNAIGIQATGASTGATNELILGGPDPEYNGCPNYLIMEHFFEDVNVPVPNIDATVETSLVVVPCSEDLLRQIPGAAVLQFLVFNEFEQRFSTSKSIICYDETRLCNIDTPNCSLSIFSANVMGTVVGQTRVQAIASPVLKGVPSAVLGIGIQKHVGSTETRSAAFNINHQGARDAADVITIP